MSQSTFENVSNMPLITFITHGGSTIEITAKSGASLMQEAVSHGVTGIIGECGGACSCATCHCYIDEAWIEKFGGPGSLEKDMLEFVSAPAFNSRLSCQIKVTDELDGAVVRLPATQY